MNTRRLLLRFASGLLTLGLFTGCESTGGGSSGGNVGVYYGVGFYNPWYYGNYDQDIDITLPDRPNRPDQPERPEQPIAQPRTSSQRSTPSIPSTPRPAARGGGGRR